MYHILQYCASISGLGKLQLMIQIRPTTQFSRNKVLLEHSDTHLLVYCLWLLFSSNGKVVAAEIGWSTKPKIKFKIWHSGREFTNLCFILYMV